MRNYFYGDIMNFTLKFIVILSVLLVSNAQAFAQGKNEPQWWFNVELIVFKRTLLPTNHENFEQEQFSLDLSNSNNMLYIEALTQASKLATLLNEIPVCNHNEKKDDVFANINDFSYLLDVPSPLTESVDTSLLSESSENINLIKTSDDQVYNKGNELSSTGVDEDNKSELSKYVQQQNKIIAVDRMIVELSQLVEVNEETAYPLTCLPTSTLESALTDFPLAIIGPELLRESGQFAGINQLLSAAELVMNNYAEQVFTQRDIQPLLYTAWRQQVKFGSDNAEFIRIRAGKRLETVKKPNYETWHKQYQAKSIVEPLSDDAAFFDDLQAAVEANDSVNWLSTVIVENEDTQFAAQRKYELDGQLKVYLDYVNQVPYLHIDNEFNHYKLVLDDNGNSTIETFPFKQKRRIVSKQIHYFDHPAFGLIVRLERFTPPVVEDIVVEEAVVEDAVVDDAVVAKDKSID